MKNVILFPDKERIEDEAARWLVRMDRAPLSSPEKVELRAWLAEDTLHVMAFERLATVWGQMDCLDVLADLIPLPTRPARPAQPRGVFAGLAASRRLGGALALGLVLVAALTLLLPPGLLPWRDGAAAVENVYQTRTGQQSQVLLGDGSKLVLNTRTEVRVHLDARQRSVFLSTGEAYFEVAPDPKAPFVVYAGNGSVRAVGTGFNVRVMEQSVEVTVAEGTVDVSTTRAATARPDSLSLRAGGTARYERRIETSGYPPTAMIERQLAWKSGKWAFDGQTLDEVVKDISRYTNQRLQIIDPRIAQLRIGGYFDLGEIEPFLQALDEGFGIKHRRIGDDLIILSSSQQTANEP